MLTVDKIINVDNNVKVDTEDSSVNLSTYEEDILERVASEFIANIPDSKKPNILSEGKNSSQNKSKDCFDNLLANYKEVDNDKKNNDAKVVDKTHPFDIDKSKEPDQQWNFRCTICMQEFKERHDVTKHIAKAHEGKKFIKSDNGALKCTWAFLCNFCKGEFSSKGSIIQHINTCHNHTMGK